MAVKLHFILYVKERIVQKVKIMMYFVKLNHRKIAISLHRET